MPAAPDFPPPPDHAPLRRALISVSDKSGLIEAGRTLAGLGVELVSTGGTRRALLEAGLACRDVAELTGFPEMMDGRVKTLHPKVHGGLLAVRDAPAHAEALAAHDIAPIDLLWVDLYPFEATLAAGAGPEAVIENIDIGGPAMIRSAAKNHPYVAVATDAEALGLVLAAAAASGGTSLSLRRRLAGRAFARTAAYDAAIAAWFAGAPGEAAAGPDEDAPAAAPYRTFGGPLAQTMRYGENPHQRGALYRTAERRPGAASARVVQGKPLGYNNVADADAAFELVAEFQDRPAIAIIKHANPCGVAVGEDLEAAYRRALECDPVSAFGGVIAASRPLDGAAARAICEIFTEVVIAPDADAEALAAFAARRNLRLLLTGALPDPAGPGEVFRSVAGGLIVQERDRARLTAADLKVVTRRAPTPREIEDLLFAFTVAKHVKSNAIVYAKDGRTAGIGAGQMNRRDSARIAAVRAREAGHALGLPSLAEGSACASEAFFPFADGLIEAVEAGARSVIQPGGSIRDAEVIAAADERDVAMVFTGVRVFRH